MERKSSGLLRRYRAALCRYLRQGRAASLEPAVRLGRQAGVLNLETLDLARIHEQVLIAYLSPIRSSIARDQVLKRAGMFFAEAILPLEKTHRIALEINGHLNSLNRTLNQRTVELAASNRELQKEVARRQAIEENLRTNEQHSIQLLEQSRHLQEQLRRLSRQVMSAQEEERKKISRELHDIVAQVLTGIHVQLANLKTEATTNTRGLAQKITRTQRMLERSVDSVHRFARELRPPMLDDLGLIPTLHSYMKDFARRTGLRVSLT
ncbi:MAG: histidine kinase, partial [Verrucomicrobiia bacterium]